MVLSLMGLVAMASLAAGADSVAGPAPWTVPPGAPGARVVAETASRAAPARAAPADSAIDAVAPDTSIVGPPAPGVEPDRASGTTDTLGAAPDTSRRAARVRRPPPGPRRGLDQPRWVMLRSLIVPGWGQVHNRAWIKAILFAGAESWLAVRVVNDRGKLDRLFAEVEAARDSIDEGRTGDLVFAYNSLLSAHQKRQWMLGGIVAYAMLDAYIDAHFRGFKLDFEPDPALPPGQGVRFSVGRRF